MSTDALRNSLLPPERRQHAADELIVAEGRVVTNAGVIAAHGARQLAVYELHQRKGLITDRQAEACDRLVNSYLTGIVGVRQAPSGTAPSTPGGYIEAMAACAADYRGARDHIGGRLWAFVFSYVIEDIPVSMIAKLRRLNPTATMELIRLGLSEVADFYGLPE